MLDRVGSVLADRRRERGGRRRRSVWLSLFLHAVVAVGFLMAPWLRAETREPLQFTGPVMIVPAATLGVREPPRPAAPEPALPEPEVEEAPLPP
ncbi:MAG: hypothetical protein ACRD0X_05030, partial [Thermoanaerobaculia bacterium]